MTDVLDIAKSQDGTGESSGGVSKYGTWLDQQAGTHEYYDADWCGAFQLWCIAQGGKEWSAAAGGVDPAFAEVQVWFDWMHAHGRTSMVPKPRRLVWYDWAGTPTGANHIGMIASVAADGRSFKAWEGNHNNRVELVTRLFDPQVMGFGEWWSYIKQPPPPVAADDSWFLGVS